MNFKDEESRDFKGKVFLIYDVPTYFNFSKKNKPEDLSILRLTQYPGYLIQLEDFSDLNEYMLASFKKSSRYKLFKYKRKLETSFDIRYKTYCGEISKEEYDFVFSSFKTLINQEISAKKNNQQ